MTCCPFTIPDDPCDQAKTRKYISEYHKFFELLRSKQIYKQMMRQLNENLNGSNVNPVGKSDAIVGAPVAPVLFSSLSTILGLKTRLGENVPKR